MAISGQRIPVAVLAQLSHADAVNDAFGSRVIAPLSATYILAPKALLKLSRPIPFGAEGRWLWALNALLTATAFGTPLAHMR